MWVTRYDQTAKLAAKMMALANGAFKATLAGTRWDAGNGKTGVKRAVSKMCGTGAVRLDAGARSSATRVFLLTAGMPYKHNEQFDCRTENVESKPVSNRFTVLLFLF
jgi:hypothetical protein